MTMQLSEENIALLFGHEAAEDESIERLRSYYLKGTTFGQVVNDLPLRILVGHKGIGKSALIRVAMDEQKQEGKLCVLIKPDDIVGIGESETDLLKLIREWKKGINEIVSRIALTSFGPAFEGWQGKLAQYGGKAVDFLQSTFKADAYANLDEAKKFILQRFVQTGKIYVYLDDLDRGWQGKKQDISRISALLNAVRDISSETPGIHFRVSLRSDVFYLVRTSDESTDKVEGSVIWQAWTNHEILALLAKRIENAFGQSIETSTLLSRSQPSLARSLDLVMETHFEGKGNWVHIPTYRMLMSLVRKRPRDIVKLCTLAARNAHSRGSAKIGTDDFNAIFAEYSQGRLQDTVNEYRSELPDIQRLLFGMKPNKLERKASSGYTYTTDALLKKIANIQEGGGFRFANQIIVDRRELAAFMYKINFLTARKEAGEFIERKYFEENRYLSQSFADFGYDWEVHPAYPWALQPDDLGSIFGSLRPSAD